ncbi:MAG: hypothetical protein KKC46_06035 [Proteobacteria bacterium]|nr:hypothetical protein [Pseudomonadota bacterium]
MKKTVIISGCLMLIMALTHPVFSQDSGREGEYQMRGNYSNSGDNHQNRWMNENINQDRPYYRVESRKVASRSDDRRGYGSHHMEDYNSSMGQGQHMEDYNDQHMGGYGSGGCN